MLDQVVISDTLQKINASINRRFEKEADLYISKQDEFELKRLLCNNLYPAVINMSVGKDISLEIILKVIVRNAGLLSIPSAKKFENGLKQVLDNVQYEAVAYMMEDVLNNTICMDKKLKHLLFSYYVKNICYQDRIKYWDDKKYVLDTDERAELFQALLQGQQADEPKFGEKWKFIVKAVDTYKYFLHDTKLLIFFKKSLTNADSKRLFKQMCDEMEQPSVMDDMYNNMIISTYVSYGDDAFNDALSALKTGHRNFKLYVKAIVELLRQNEDSDVITDRFDSFYKLYQQQIFGRHINDELDRKVWKAAKKNAKLYMERKQQIDNFLPVEEHVQYNSFDEVFHDVADGKKAARIAYVWLNMKQDTLRQSLLDAFISDSWEYEDEMREVFEWIFKHNQRRGSDYLKKICENVAKALLEHGKAEDVFAVVADRLLLKNVLEYNVKGNSVKDYLATFHFEEYKTRYLE